MSGNQKAICKVHYGWVIVFCSGLLIFYTIGLIVNSFSLFLNPLILSLNISKTRASSIAAVQNVGGILMTFVAGRFCQRVGLRKAILFGGIFAVAGYYYLSTVSDLMGCYIGYFLVGCAYGLGGTVPTTILITNWFCKQKGLALSLSSLASAFSTIIYPLVISFLLDRTNIFGVYKFLSLNVLVIVVTAFLLVRDHPSDMGLFPYGLQANLVKKEQVSAPKHDLGDLLKLRPIRLSLVVAFFQGVIISTVSSHISIFYTGEGFSAEFAASMVSLFGVIMLVAKPIYGILLDRVSLEKINLSILSCMISAMAVPFFFHINPIIPPMFVVLYGLTSPLSSMIFPLWAEQLGKNCGGVGVVYPLFKGFCSLGAITLLTLPGFIADHCGSYIPVFIIYLLFSIASVFLIRRALRLTDTQEEHTHG